MLSEPAGRSVVAAKPLTPPSKVAGCSSVSMPLEVAHLRPSKIGATFLV